MPEVVPAKRPKPVNGQPVNGQPVVVVPSNSPYTPSAVTPTTAVGVTGQTVNGGQVARRPPLDINIFSLVPPTRADIAAIERTIREALLAAGA